MNDHISTPEEYDVVVLGSGEAGKYIAWTSAKKGKRTVVIERKYVGGSCPKLPVSPAKRQGRLVLQEKRGVRNNRR